MDVDEKELVELDASYTDRMVTLARRMFALHYPGYNYLGMGTPVNPYYLSHYRPVNWLDEAAMNHDIEYDNIIRTTGSYAEAYRRFNSADERFMHAIKNRWHRTLINHRNGRGMPLRMQPWYKASKIAYYVFETKRLLDDGSSFAEVFLRVRPWIDDVTRGEDVDNPVLDFAPAHELVSQSALRLRRMLRNKVRRSSESLYPLPIAAPPDERLLVAHVSDEDDPKSKLPLHRRYFTLIGGRFVVTDDKAPSMPYMTIIN